MCGPSPIFHFWQLEGVGEECWVWADLDALASPPQAITEMELLNELKLPALPNPSCNHRTDVSQGSIPASSEPTLHV